MPITLDGTSGITAGAYTDIEQADLATALNASGSAPIYACRAWVNFNGTGTVAIRGSGNVTSITDNGVGDYTINLTTAMPDTNYVFSGYARRGATDTNSMLALPQAGTYSTTALQVRTQFSSSFGVVDCDLVVVTVVR